MSNCYHLTLGLKMFPGGLEIETYRGKLSQLPGKMSIHRFLSRFSGARAALQQSGSGVVSKTDSN